MKTAFKIFGIITLTAIIVVSMAGCGDGGSNNNVCNYPKLGTSGRLTITGLDTYEGLFVYGFSQEKTGLYSTFEAHSDKDPNYGVKVIKGSVTLMVWMYSNTMVWYCLGDSPDGTHSDCGIHEVSYSGNDSNVTFDITTSNIENWFLGTLHIPGTVTVDFKNGIASGVFVPK
jgi:hypothetical protein